MGNRRQGRAGSLGCPHCASWGFPGGSDSEKPACNAGDSGSILGQEDPLEAGMATQNQYPCLENLMDRGAWRATVHAVAKSQTLSWCISGTQSKNSTRKQKRIHRLREGAYGCPREGWTVRELGTFVYTLLYLKWVNNQDLLCSTENSAQC